MKLCSPENGGNFIDCTFGSGGYSDAILSFKNTKVISLDRDSNTIDYASEIKKKYNDRFIFYNEKFSNLDRVIKKDFKADFIIFDLGISSMQIFNLDRGFSFKSKSNVDMRMGLNSISAQDVLNKYDFKKLKNIIKYFGDEKESSRIASNIIKEREKSPINSIPRLVEIIEKSKKKNYKKKNKYLYSNFSSNKNFCK